MPEMNTEKKSISVVLSSEAKAALEALAQQQSRSGKKKNASDVIRDAIQRYLADEGHELTITVERGGYRERTAS